MLNPDEAKGRVSFTLFGDKPMYLRGAVKNAELWKSGPLNVDCLFFLGDSVPDDLEKELLDLGAQTIRMNGAKEDQTATFWRYGAFPISRGYYDYVLCRDVDSRPTDREYYAINEWLRSRFPFHVIRDHPFHGVPILAGLFGVKSELFDLMSEILPVSIPDNFYEIIVRACNHTDVRYTSNDFYQVDQWWLRLNVYPHLRDRIMAHDEFFGFERKRYRFWMPDRVDNEFVAECRLENEELRHPDHRALIDGWPRRNRP